MAGITHTKVSIIADDPNYDIQPTDWNAEHAIAATIPNVATTAANDFLVGNGTAWQKKTKAEARTAMGVETKTWGATISNPQAVYAQRAQVFIAKTAAAVTVTSIFADCNDPTPTAEIAWDLKFADDMHDGVFANATVIDVMDTTNGTFSATSFDDATIPAGKFVYIQFDSSPHADIKDILVDIKYTVD